MNPDEELPPLAWRWLSILAVILLLVIVSGIGLISAGVFDPKPLGSAKVEYPLNPVDIQGNSQELNWIENQISLAMFTVRLTASRLRGEVDIAYGLAIGDKNDYLVVAVSPLGYYSIWRGSDLASQTENNQVIESWQTWPHVRTDENDNEIWIDVQNDRITSIRINREILWQEPLPIHSRGIGLWVQSFGEPAVIDFQKIELFSQQVE
ncbi:MAG: hypothetical protein AMJ56_16285 [Anaerolineae bacterium SG8_19]|nr:MAG: hypothetical protein AMJ56_16285 [Anaerolineae bacterium SG8_19]